MPTGESNTETVRGSDPSEDHRRQCTQPENALHTQHAAEPIPRDGGLYPVPVFHRGAESVRGRPTQRRSDDDGGNDETGTHPHTYGHRVETDGPPQRRTGEQCSDTRQLTNSLGSLETAEERPGVIEPGCHRSPDVTGNQQFVTEPGSREGDVKDGQGRSHAVPDDPRLRFSMDTLESALRIRRAELADDLDQLTSPPEEGSSVAFGKRIGDGTTEAVERFATTATARSIAKSIRDLDRALEKLQDGTYGVCDRCDGQIGIERLQAIPATSICVVCAESL